MDAPFERGPAETLAHFGAEHLPAREAVRYAIAAGLRQARPKGGLLDQPSKLAIGQGIGRAAGRQSHRGRATGHGLQQNDAKALAGRRQYEQISGGVQVGQVFARGVPEEAHTIGDAQAFR